MALVLKKLVSRSSSVAVPYLRRPPNHPRHFIAATGDILKTWSRHLVFGCPTDMVPKYANKYLFCIPHTMCLTSRVTGIEARGLSGGDEDTTLGTSMKFSLHIPGNEKITDTPENLYIFIDMGLHKNLVTDDLDVNAFQTQLQDHNGLKNVLSIEGFVQKLDIRRHYTAVVPLPPNIKVIKPAGYGDFSIHPENGGVVVTVPKQQETS